jgi:phthalate 4,5-cis-dihydrodiol dehydrogenase
MARDPSTNGPTLRLGIIGLGGATRQILPSLAGHPRVRIVAGADPRAEARERFAADFGAGAFARAEQLCASAAVDAVYIATPHQYHRENAVAAADAGKHIILEKPMALTLDDCDAIIEAAARNHVQLVVGHTHGFDRPIAKMREIIRSGELGALAMVNMWSYSNFLYRPRRPEELDTKQGGGIIFNQVPHQVDVARLLGGGLVRSVRSMAWTLDPARPTEGSHVTFLQFESGAAASLVFSGYDYFDSDEFHFWVGEMGEEKQPDRHGSARAALEKLGSPDAEAFLKSAAAYGKASTAPAGEGRRHHPHCGVVIATCAGGDLRPSADGVLLYGRQGRVEIPVPYGPGFPDKGGVLEELYDAWASGRPPLHSGAWGKATMEVALAVLTSARERREVTLHHQVPAADG